MQIQIPEKILDAFSRTKRYIVLYGGRGSAKSQSVARILLFEGFRHKTRVLCCREVQNSISDSVHSLLKDLIQENEAYNNFYKITDTEIRGANGTQFIFRGLKKETAGSIKSIEGVDICWVEEAQFICRNSLDILTPTIRKDGSIIIFTMNPTNDNDPVYVDFVKTNREDTVKAEVNYYDNPFLPDVLKREMEYDRKTNIDKYNHVWMGQIAKHSDRQVFNGKWVIESFESKDEDYLHGIDWGFANDPTVLIRCFIRGMDLYIDQEAYGIGIEINDLPELFSKVETSKAWRSIADNSRPETISYIRNKGFNINACSKWKGSVEDGVEFIKSFERVIIHPRCKHTIDEFKMYSYKTDKLTGEIQPVIEDANNHCIDAIRYALDDVIKQRMIADTGITASMFGI